MKPNFSGSFQVYLTVCSSARRKEVGDTCISLILNTLRKFANLKDTLEKLDFLVENYFVTQINLIDRVSNVDICISGFLKMKAYMY